MSEEIAYCTGCNAVTFHNNGVCVICGQQNKVYDNLFHDPNVQALRTSRESKGLRKDSK